MWVHENYFASLVSCRTLQFFNKQIVVRFNQVHVKKIGQRLSYANIFWPFENSWIRCWFGWKYWLLYAMGFMRKTSANGFQTVRRRRTEKSRHNAHFSIWAANFRKTSQRFREPLTLNEQETSEWVIWNDHVDSCHWFIGHALNTPRQRERTECIIRENLHCHLAKAMRFTVVSFPGISAIDAKQRRALRSSVCFFWFHFDFTVLILDHKLPVCIRIWNERPDKASFQECVRAHKMALIPFLPPTVDQLTSGIACIFLLRFAEFFVIIIIVVVVFCRLKKILWRLIRHI